MISHPISDNLQAIIELSKNKKHSRYYVMSNAPDRILAEQLRLLFAAMPLSLFGSTLNAGILVAVLWEVSNQTQLLVWLGLPVH